MAYTTSKNTYKPLSPDNISNRTIRVKTHFKLKIFINKGRSQDIKSHHSHLLQCSNEIGPLVYKTCQKIKYMKGNTTWEKVVLEP